MILKSRCFTFSVEPMLRGDKLEQSRELFIEEMKGKKGAPLPKCDVIYGYHTFKQVIWEALNKARSEYERCLIEGQVMEALADLLRELHCAIPLVGEQRELWRQYLDKVGVEAESQTEAPQ